jgi:hypothetical protein
MNVSGFEFPPGGAGKTVWPRYAVKNRDILSGIDRRITAAPVPARIKFP